MKTILHIGSGKTGSTALQDMLNGSQDVLLANGVLYPKNPDGISFNNHRLLSVVLGEFETLPASIRAAYPDKAALEVAHQAFLEALAAQVAAARPSSLLLSSEALFRGVPDDYRGAFEEQLARFGVTDAVVPVYIRLPSARYLSSFQQTLKTEGKMVPPGKPKFLYVLEGYRAIFGAGSVRPQVFSRSALPGGDVTRDFHERFLAPEGVDYDQLTPSVGGQCVAQRRKYENPRSLPARA